MNNNVEELKAKENGNLKIWLRIAAERLSQLRYVYLVQIEDGIPTANQRACLEYADAVLIGWPDEDAAQVMNLNESQLDQVRKVICEMEDKIPLFREQERAGDIDLLSQTLVIITECVAQVRRHYQPDFPLPTYQEIHKVVQQEWNEDMNRIDPEQVTSSEEVKGMQKESYEPHTQSHVGTGLSPRMAEHMEEDAKAKGHGKA